MLFVDAVVNGDGVDGLVLRHLLGMTCRCDLKARKLKRSLILHQNDRIKRIIDI
jgi:hypothetical protein